MKEKFLLQFRKKYVRVVFFWVGDDCLPTLPAPTALAGRKLEDHTWLGCIEDAYIWAQVVSTHKIWKLNTSQERLNMCLEACRDLCDLWFFDYYMIHTPRVSYLLISTGILLSKLDEIIPVAKLTKFIVLLRLLLFL